MDNYQKYIDAMSDLAMMMKDGQGDTDAAKAIRTRMNDLWEKLTEEEKVWADEQTLRMQLWIGI